MKRKLNTGPAIALDFDGVVIDSLRRQHQAVNHVLRQCGLPEIPYLKFRQVFFSPYFECYGRLGVTLGRQEVSRLYQESLNGDELPLFPDVLPTLLHYKKLGIPIAIISCERREVIRRRCKKEGILDLISKIHGDLVTKEWSLCIFAQAQRRRPEDIWYFGDTISDMRDAISVGARAVGVTRGDPIEADLRAAGAQHVIGHLSETGSLIPVLRQRELDFEGT